jgi:hypothetical protein
MSRDDDTMLALGEGADHMVAMRGELSTHVVLKSPTDANSPPGRSETSRYAASALATTDVVQSMTVDGLTTWRCIPSSLGSSPSASPTSWGR